MPDPKLAVPAMKNAASAPIVYFDNAPVFGQSNGIVQVELAANFVTAKGPKEVAIEQTCAAHLRCSLVAAQNLVAALQGAINLAIQAQAEQHRAAMTAHDRMAAEYPQAAE
jgi:hypothetical protein